MSNSAPVPGIDPVNTPPHTPVTINTDFWGPIKAKVPVPLEWKPTGKLGLAPEKTSYDIDDDIYVQEWLNWDWQVKELDAPKPNICVSSRGMSAPIHEVDTVIQTEEERALGSTPNLESIYAYDMDGQRTTTNEETISRVEGEVTGYLDSLEEGSVEARIRGPKKGLEDLNYMM